MKNTNIISGTEKVIANSIVVIILLIFYFNVDTIKYDDIAVYQSTMDNFQNGSENLSLSLINNIYEPASNFIFYVFSLIGISALQLHILVLITIYNLCIHYQFKNCITLYIFTATIVTPFLFGGLLLGQTRQLFGLALILLFYKNIPPFSFFSKSNINYLSLSRVIFFALSLYLTHLGSFFIFFIVLIFDLVNFIQNRNNNIDLKFHYILFLISAFIFFYCAIPSTLALSKFNFYYYNKNLPHINYLTSSMSILIMLPMLFDSLLSRIFLKKILITFLLIITLIFLGKITNLGFIIDRALPSLVFLLYVDRLRIGHFVAEKIFVYLRILSLFAYLILM